MDNAMAVAVFERGRGWDSFIQVCACKHWLIGAEHNITLGMSHVPCELVMESADALSRYYVAQVFTDRVNHLVEKGVKIIQPVTFALHLCSSVLG